MERSEQTDKYLGEMLAMWKELLERDEVDPDDNFFELGGTSLKAMLLLNRIENAYDIEIETEELADHQTAREVAAMVGEKRAPFDRLAERGQGKQG